ncbi:SDR family oxidoreductase [Azospirillum picis]|uniref:NAD(P)-dependent dehydrogenase (Short-subunit alcohol dehydrogenase family) n=1 Tax=Azospirillum picis TaxID=488438 RepID=A0ABU0MH31_9PROT|nr:SDR family oxidoreductase [Azospirillum picis]MBP2298407.1 NAD(P)-dependent dehydrogenase (short-subunit alcohol dehydrogenase family) [Azospirillum picis]MDQ0532544.1 NAD(P)-dependent dehydrogenase (short-subunit alcohol dehydrogenase family) [Azospirillum picis]
MRNLHGAVVVVAGASSGIGRATALAFAREGARLVLASRREELLDEVAEDCRGLGADTVALPTDVTDPEAVRRLADRAVEEFGAIDVWIANAGVGALGRFDDTPVEAHRRVIETNLLGPLHGAHSVLPVFRRQGRGTFIATVSVGAWAPAPYAAAYAASKFGLDGLLESLRAELVDSPDLHVCGVYPSFTDTPGMSHAANYTGHELAPESPFYDDPEDVAKTMVAVARRPRARAMVGALTPLTRLGHATVPRVVERVAGHGARRHFEKQPPASTTDGNLFRPVVEGRGITGGFRTPMPAWISPVLMAGVAVAAAAAYGSFARGPDGRLRRR